MFVKRCPFGTTFAIAYFLLAVILAGGVPAPARADSTSGSIAFDKLNLTTPDSALRNFLIAYRDSDFVTAYWIFAPESQKAWFSRLAELRMSMLVSNFSMDDKLAFIDMLPSMRDREQSDDSFLFGRLMVAAKRHGMLPINIDGLPSDLSQQNLPVLGKKTQTPTGEVDIAIALQNYDHPVVFRLQLAKSGRWRLLQIIPPGGDEKSIPFGLAEK